MSDPKQELTDKVTSLVDQKFGGDWDRAFRHYATLGGNTGIVDRDGLKTLLKDAGIGNGFTRGAWTSGIIKELDSDKDQSISWSEFKAVFE